MRKYRIGEVSKMLDVPVETIRFLEQKGLVSPEKNAENGYRYYNIWHVNQILEYKKYRQVGFNSKEAVSLVNGCSLEALIDQFEDKKKDASYLAHYYQAKALKLNNFQEVLSSAEKLVGNYYIMNRPENYSLFFGSYDEKELHVSYAHETEGGFDELTRQYPFVEHTFRIRQSDFLASTANIEVQWGFTVKKRWVDRLRIQLYPQMEHFRSVPSIFTFVRVLQKQFVTASLLQGIFDFMHEHGYELNGDITLTYIATVNENGQNVRYMEVWTPIKDAYNDCKFLTSEDSERQTLEQIFS